MLKRFLCLLLFLYSASALFSQPDTLLILHPTVSNIKTLIFLSENKLFPVENYHFLGVYHNKETYDYSTSSNYISGNRITNFSLFKVDEPISDTDLFRQNQCSDIFHELFLLSEGAFFMGGPDIPPHLYSDSVNLLSTVTDPFRHYFELSFIFHILGRGDDTGFKPFIMKNKSYLVSGICLGMQTLNVATGGSLFQDIPMEIYGINFANQLVNQPPDQVHRNYYKNLEFSDSVFTGYHFHKVIPLKTGFISNRMQYESKSEPDVLSAHHQSVKRIGNGLKAAAHSVDGQIIEAIEHETYKNVFGVQFHPEKIGLYNPEIIYYVNTDSTINFNSHIKNTPSFSFHQKYWGMLAKILNGERAIQSQ